MTTTPTELLLELPLNPVPASRPRITVRGGFASAYYAGPYATYKNKLGLNALHQTLDSIGWVAPFQGPVAVSVVFFVRRPKKTKLLYPKPDIDNYAKAILDLLQPCVIKDDHQVITLTSSKHWTPTHQTPPLTLVILRSLDMKRVPNAGLKTILESMTTTMRSALAAGTTDMLMELSKQ